jgi:ketosteroid isomerase-like protein
VRFATKIAAASVVACVSLSAQRSERQPVEAFAAMQRLNARLLESRSATATLERWCGERRLSDPPRVVAEVIDSHKAPSRAQLRRLGVTSARDVKYRHVRLRCGAYVLSEADNWYVPARLTPEMNRVLETTRTPFGAAVAALEPSRTTFEMKLLWTDAAAQMPLSLFEHHAILYTRDHQPFSEVAEVYRRDLLHDATTAAPSDSAERDVRAARIAQNDAIASGDIDRAASFWTDDVTVRRALGQAITGAAAARLALEPAASPSPRIVYQRTTTSVDVSARWPLAFEAGTWEGRLDSVRGPAIIGGRFSAQWVRRNDRWLIRSEVFVALTCSDVGCQSIAAP